MNEITIEPRKLPKCPCGAQLWRVYQRVEKNSNMVRVDGFADIVVKVPEQEDQLQSVLLKCLECGDTFQPQSGIGVTLEMPAGMVTIDAYSEDTGDHLHTPARVESETLYSDIDDFDEHVKVNYE